MSNIQVPGIMYQTLQPTLKLALPFLPVGMVVRVTIAIFQVTTQINEQTMNLVPELLSILAMMGVLGNLMLALLQDFTRQILSMTTGGQLCMLIPFSSTIMHMSEAIVLNPVFGRANVPSRARAALILVISLMLYTGPGGTLVHGPAVMTEYGVILIKELLLGFTLGLGMELTFLAARSVSAVMDYPMGLITAQVYDPQYNAQMTTTIGMHYAFTITLFLATNGHSQLLTILFIFCGLIPFGTATFRPELTQAILSMFRESTAMGLQFAFPLVTMKLVAETAAGILMRTTPQINVFIVNFQIRVIVGVSMLPFLFSLISDRLYVILNGIYQSLQRITTLMRQEVGGK